MISNHTHSETNSLHVQIPHKIPRVEPGFSLNGKLGFTCEDLIDSIDETEILR